MHFWIDKRSQACGFNGRYGVPASLAAGRRNKSMVTPVHRFRPIESSTVTQQLRRNCPQHMSQPRPGSHQSDQCQSSATVLSQELANGSTIPRRTPPPELDAPVFLNAPLEGAIDTVSHAQFMRFGGMTKYGMWASFGLTTVSVAATKFYVDHQGTFEILLLSTLGVLSAGLLVSCILSICKRKTPQQFVNITPPPVQTTTIEMDIPEVMPEREIIISPMNNISQQSTIEARPIQELEQPPPPYHIAILLPVKDTDCAEFPPPTYENAVR